MCNPTLASPSFEFLHQGRSDATSLMIWSNEDCPNDGTLQACRSHDFVCQNSNQNFTCSHQLAHPLRGEVGSNGSDDLGRVILGIGFPKSPDNHSADGFSIMADGWAD